MTLRRGPGNRTHLPFRGRGAITSATATRRPAGQGRNVATTSTRGPCHHTPPPVLAGSRSHTRPAGRDGVAAMTLTRCPSHHIHPLYCRSGATSPAWRAGVGRRR